MTKWQGRQEFYADWGKRGGARHLQLLRGEAGFVQLLARACIFTSNLGLGDLEKIDTRIASRIVREPGNQFIELDTVPSMLRGR